MRRSSIVGAGCLLLLVLTHVFEALHFLPWIGWGRPDSVGHYLNVTVAVAGCALIGIRDGLDPDELTGASFKVTAGTEVDITETRRNLASHVVADCRPVVARGHYLTSGNSLLIAETRRFQPK